MVATGLMRKPHNMYIFVAVEVSQFDPKPVQIYAHFDAFSTTLGCDELNRFEYLQYPGEPSAARLLSRSRIRRDDRSGRAGAGTLPAHVECDAGTFSEGTSSQEEVRGPVLPDPGHH